MGAPQEFVRLEKRMADELIIPVVKPYLTSPVMIEKWPDVPSDSRPPRADTDIFLEFPREGIVEPATGDSLVYETAKGYSGGGVWDLGFEPGVLWQPSRIGLFGIQSSWHPKKRYLRAVQVLHWLRLIYEDYADLRLELTKLFPELARQD